MTLPLFPDAPAGGSPGHGASVSAAADPGLEGSPSPAARLQAWDPGHWPVAPDWRSTVDAFLDSPAGQALGGFVDARLEAGAVVFPPQPFRALALTPLASVRAVVLGQDPYHGAGQAEGLAFSVAPGVRVPPSLRNIFKERDEQPPNGSLVDWARRGVLLLNTSLTVEEGQPASHARRGWEPLTDALIERTAGAHGRQALVIQTNHPSPLSASRGPTPFIGSGQFVRARQWLAERGVSGVV